MRKDPHLDMFSMKFQKQEKGWACCSSHHKLGGVGGVWFVVDAVGSEAWYVAEASDTTIS